MANEKIKPGDKMISSHIYDCDKVQVLNKSWKYNLPIKDGDVLLTNKPFKVCRIKNFLRRPLGTYDLRGELLSVHNRKRGTDLMTLEESVCDLQDVTKDQTYSQNTECIKHFCSELLADFKPWLEKVTGLSLDNKLSIRTSRYGDSDFLLCHNDQIEDRVIAFILYLSKDWKDEYGGQLNLFSSEKEVPVEIDKSFVPEYNSLLFFEVTNHSFHSVSEVLGDVERFSVNGWFHGVPKTSPPLPRYGRSFRVVVPTDSKFNLTTFIDETKLFDRVYLKLINTVVELLSYCGIKEYVKQDQYNSLLEEITSNSIKWKKVGPPDQNNYETADLTSLPKQLRRFVYMFSTVAFCQLLKRYTDLDVIPSGRMNSVKIELQRWRQGSYTILQDKTTIALCNRLVKSIITPEEHWNQAPEEKPTSRKTTRKSDSEMLDDILIDSNDFTKVFPDLVELLERNADSGQSNDEAPGCSTTEDDNEDIAAKRRKIEKEENSDSDGEESETKGTLDVVMYFHAENAPPDTTLSYVIPENEDGVMLTLPIRDNCLFMVYRQPGVVRYNEYINHYCKGNFYSLVCSYKE